ncbi:hypothetical protein CLAFUW4_04001 [Fulvia fulva]|uniref:RING-type domain-containing protein n=1 Tax=Passalora fulva TaxID=5499 RepID=A0A9Q8P8E5_PASFU|nr:uncharacterized protein CLAFUR5_03966 [Fulvia fulva]KAK4626625.1 hypothetical protein CLAFUR4_03987 [Fulvia fulva]KAK4627406.1 hypothetical protein CLAFUR0_03988 [Fulvia fulva]UJO17145.1 hypothetical protein CLAFUR5_03966 [Fulvia fulva]WPV13529.1 hypothetical protein CLAFUW4_04001 [Fulvia fulva]WPV28277.1 hypothetical protein CLAFUW7_03990 [Fulvia fulva]
MPKQPKSTISKQSRPNPLSRPVNKPTFTCDACMADFNNQNPIEIHGDSVCRDCFDTGIKPQFEQAAASETQYPVKWGGKIIELNKDIQKFFSKSFRETWTARVREYETSSKERVYCAGSASNTEPCGLFLGTKAKHRLAKKCNCCGYYSCADCETSFPADPSEHICAEAADEPVDDPFQGLERGRDYQRCPVCDVAIELRDGCNHMTCSMGNCNTHFCFLCGEPATRDSGHWTVGRPCPLYNRAGEGNAQYDHQAAAPPPAEEVAVMEALLVEINAETQGVISHADDPPELRLRRLDRRWLEELRVQLEREHQEAQEAGQQEAPYYQALLALIPGLQVLSGWYTLHLEQDERTRGHKRTLLTGAGLPLGTFLIILPPGTMDRYPRVSAIMRIVLAGLGGEDMNTVAAERLAEADDDA